MNNDDDNTVNFYLQIVIYDGFGVYYRTQERRERDTIQFDLDESVARASFDELRSDNVWIAQLEGSVLNIFYLHIF